MKKEGLDRGAGGNGRMAKTRRGLEWERYFTRKGISPYDANRLGVPNSLDSQ